jgi:hypothetical protein
MIADLQPAVSAWLEQSCAAQGVPVHVTDPIVLRPVAAILITSDRTAAAATQAAAPRRVSERSLRKTGALQEHGNDHAASLPPQRLNGLPGDQTAGLHESRGGIAARATRSCASGRSSLSVSPVGVAGTAELGPV